jgi:hypothetical protein
MLLQLNSSKKCPALDARLCDIAHVLTQYRCLLPAQAISWSNPAARSASGAHAAHIDLTLTSWQASHYRSPSRINLLRRSWFQVCLTPLCAWRDVRSKQICSSGAIYSNAVKEIGTIDIVVDTRGKFGLWSEAYPRNATRTPARCVRGREARHGRGSSSEYSSRCGFDSRDGRAVCRRPVCLPPLYLLPRDITPRANRIEPSVNLCTSEAWWKTQVNVCDGLGHGRAKTASSKDPTNVNAQSLALCVANMGEQIKRRSEAALIPTVYFHQGLGKSGGRRTSARSEHALSNPTACTQPNPHQSFFREGKAHVTWTLPTDEPISHDIGAMRIKQKRGAIGSEDAFICNKRERDASRPSFPRRGQPTKRKKHSHRCSFHVSSAEPEEPPPRFSQCERRIEPGCRVTRGHCVEMRIEDEVSAWPVLDLCENVWLLWVACEDPMRDPGTFKETHAFSYNPRSHSGWIDAVARHDPAEQPNSLFRFERVNMTLDRINQPYLLKRLFVPRPLGTIRKLTKLHN